MSTEAVHELLKKAERDADLEAALQKALRHQERPIESFLATAREHGFEFTADEFLEVMPPRPGSDSGELSDGDLDSVSGGVLPFSSAATNLFRSFRSVPSIKSIGIGGPGQSEDEEQIQM